MNQDIEIVLISRLLRQIHSPARLQQLVSVYHSRVQHLFYDCGQNVETAASSKAILRLCDVQALGNSFGKDDEEDEDVIVELPDSSLEPGILPTQIRMLVQRRREVTQQYSLCTNDDGLLVHVGQKTLEDGT